MKIVLYYLPLNELRRFFDIIRAIDTMPATMLDIAPYTFDQTFQKKNFLFNSADCDYRFKKQRR